MPWAHFDIVQVQGEIDFATAPWLADALAAARPACTLVVDLSQCRYLDSSAINVLASAWRARSAAFRVVVPPHLPVRRVFSITGMESLLGVEDSLDDALRADSGAS